MISARDCPETFTPNDRFGDKSRQTYGAILEGTCIQACIDYCKFEPDPVFYLRTFLVIHSSADRRYLVFRGARTLEKYNRYLRPLKNEKEIGQKRPIHGERD